MIIVNVEQNSPEWLSLKAGVPSTSQFGCIVTSQGKVSKQRDKYLRTLAGERVMGYRRAGYSNSSMEFGIETEEQASREFTKRMGFKVGLVGICYPDEGKKYLSSPDRLLLDSNNDPAGTLEIKCPDVHTHVEYLLAGKIPSKYVVQVQGQLLVTGLDTAYFVSYAPDIKPLIVKVERDEGLIDMLRSELDKFCKELDELVDKIKED